ncbi:MAG: hypothetical protein AAGL49_15500, partial [Pseudomonadota bacterium]
MADLEHNAAPVRFRFQPHRLGGGCCERLLNQDVAAGLQRFHRKWEMGDGRRSDRHNVHIGEKRIESIEHWRADRGDRRTLRQFRSLGRGQP